MQEQGVDDPHDGSLGEQGGQPASGEAFSSWYSFIVSRCRRSIAAVPLLQVAQPGREPRPGLLGLRLRDADGDERRAHEQRHEDDGGRGRRRAPAKGVRMPASHSSAP